MQGLILCLDVSESMGYGKPTKLTQANEAALRAVKGLSKDALVGLVTFDSQAEVILDLEHANLGTVRAEFEELTVRGVSCVGAGVMEAAGLLEKDHLSGSILLLTDGRANLSLNRSGGFEGSLDLEREMLDISEQVHRKSTTIHAVSVGEDAFTYTLSIIAEHTRGFHWIAESFQRLDSQPEKLQLKARVEDLRVHRAPAELPSAQPAWTKESQFTHLAVVSQSLYRTYESSHMAFVINPENNRECRTALISVEDESLRGYRERRPETVQEIRNDAAILLDKSYREYLDLVRNSLADMFIH